MDGQGVFRRNRPSWVFSIVGVVLAAVIVVGIGPPGFLLQHVTVCQLGPEIGTYTIWTPITIANIPDGGNVTVAFNQWNLTMTSGSLSTNPLQPFGGPIQGEVKFGSGTNVGIEVQYGDFNWTFFGTSNVTKVGGVPGPCTQPYIAQISIPGGACGGFDYVPLVDNASDAVQPHIWNGTAGDNGTRGQPGCPVQTPGTYVWFDSSFHAGGSGAAQPVRWDLCNSTGKFPLTLQAVARVPIAVTVPFVGGNISATGLLAWYIPPSTFGPTANYELSGGWQWMLSPVGPSTSQISPYTLLPGLVAFERLSC